MEKNIIFLHLERDMKTAGNPDIIFRKTELLPKTNGYPGMCGLTVKAANVTI